jgi:hypothetical protein
MKRTSLRKCFAVRFGLAFVTSALLPMLPATAQTLEPPEAASEPPELAPNEEWVQRWVVPQREAEYEDVPYYAPTGLACTTTPAATMYALGRNQPDVIIYGMVVKCTDPDRSWTCSLAGLGACIFNYSSSGGSCHIGAAHDHHSAGSANPYGVKGDGAGSYQDEIYPADYCTTTHIHCEYLSPYYFQVGMSNVPAGTQWEICGDDCSVDEGGDDKIVGWNNRDWIFGGAGDDTIYGQGGSDCIFGDYDDDWIEGNSCDAANDEYLWGGLGNDSITNNTGTCARYILGGGGDDNPVKGGAGNDTIYGDTGNDYLYGLDGTDYCNGGAHTTQDWCESPGCDTRVDCEAP